MKKNKHALVLSGGAFNGAFQIGALNYLQENWQIFRPNETMHFDVVAGVSVGSLNGSLIAQERMDLLNELWNQVKENGVSEVYTSDFIDNTSDPNKATITLNIEALAARLIPNFKPQINFFKLFFNKKALLKDNLDELKKELEKNISSFKSIADNSPLKEKIKDVINRKEITKTKYFCGFVSLDDGEYRSIEQASFDSDEDFQNGVLASTVMPIVWEPIEKIGANGLTILNSVDGGIKNVSPLGDVIRAIEDDQSDSDYTIFVINTSSGIIKEKDMGEANVASIALRALTDITINEIFNNDLKEFIRINDVLEQLKEKSLDVSLFNYDFGNKKRSNKILKRFKAIIIQPDDGVLGDSLAASPELVERRISHGREKMQKALALYSDGDGKMLQCIV